MRAFRVLLGVMFVCLASYTAIVGMRHGWNLLPVFFGDIAAMSWPGQFNADFLCLLVLSGLWIAWRHRFSPTGLALGLLGLFGGASVLMPYLFIASLGAGGDVKVLLLGRDRARG